MGCAVGSQASSCEAQVASTWMAYAAEHGIQRIVDHCRKHPEQIPAIEKFCESGLCLNGDDKTKQQISFP
eukprot:11211840-Lingulodinium_polyedra.AAC.1